MKKILILIFLTNFSQITRAADFPYDPDTKIAKTIENRWFNPLRAFGAGEIAGTLLALTGITLFAISKKDPQNTSDLKNILSRAITPNKFFASLAVGTTLGSITAFKCYKEEQECPTDDEFWTKANTEIKSYTIKQYSPEQRIAATEELPIFCATLEHLQKTGRLKVSRLCVTELIKDANSKLEFIKKQDAHK